MFLQVLSVFSVISGSLCDQIVFSTLVYEQLPIARASQVGWGEGLRI